jgi:LytS/YehU family sensor histidine kinase
VIAIADGVIICVLGLLIVRFHQLEAEMRQAYDSLRHQQERETQLRELATRAELTALQAQINPHFLFNTLNSISALIGKDAVRANHALEKLAGLFRYTLGASRRPTVRLEEEWRFVQDYLSIESIRLGPRLKIEATLDPAARDWPLPGLLLQPIVENAVVHGVALYPSGGKVRLTARLIGETLQIEISDVPLNPAESGASPAATMLRTPADGHGHAIENIRRRLEAAYPGRHQLSFESQPGQGTRVTLEIAAEAAPAAATLSQAVQRES